MKREENATQERHHRFQFSNCMLSDFYHSLKLRGKKREANK
jgi:hypothetical protein